MISEIIEILKNFEVTTLISMFILYYFLKKELTKKFDKIDEDMKEIRTSLNRMEGAFYSKDCCMLKDEKSKKKVE